MRSLRWTFNGLMDVSKELAVEKQKKLNTLRAQRVTV